MRIIGYLETENYKTTVFKSGERFTVKFEDGLFEQSFKFRESEQIVGLWDIKKMIDEPFKQQVAERFVEMKKAAGDLLRRYVEQQEEEDWEDIL